MANKNCDVTVEADKLTITPVGGNAVNVQDGRYTYDAEAHGLKDAFATQPGSTILYRAEGSDIWSPTAPTFTDAGAYVVYVKATNPNYDETAEVKGTVTIDLAKLVVSTEGASKTYDGTPLTNPKNMAVGLAKAAGGKETVTLTNTGTITDVGKVENGYTITWDGTAKESNYTVADGEIGTLKVLPAAFEVQAEGYTM